MFDATCKVINTISEEGANYKQHSDAKGVYQVLTSFKFILIIYLMKEIMGITNILCQALQQHSQDLLKAMHLVSTTKLPIQKFQQQNHLYHFVSNMKLIFLIWILVTLKVEIDIVVQMKITMEQHFRIGIFIVAIDFQLQ